MATTDVVPAGDQAHPRVGARRARVSDGLDRGLPAHWFPIMRSAELLQQPKRLRRFGLDLAVWRDAAGRPHVFEDRCPHRGSALSLGKVQGNELACWYHGWCFDTAGACTQMPLEDPSPARLARVRVKSFPAEDRGGYIWAFYGDTARLTPLVHVPYELEDARWVVFRQDYVWQTNWLNVLDNVLDPLHAIFVHAGAYTQRKRARFKAFEIRQESDEGFRLGRLGYREDGSVGPVEGETEFLLPNLLRLDLADGSERGIMRIVMLPTPIDDESTYLVYLQARRVNGLARLRWRLVWWLWWRRAQDLIKWQDATLLATVAPIGEVRVSEHLASSDRGVIHLRRVLHRAYARAQASAPALPASQGAPAQLPAPIPREPFAPWEIAADAREGAR